MELNRKEINLDFVFTVGGKNAADKRNWPGVVSVVSEYNQSNNKNGKIFNMPTQGRYKLQYMIVPQSSAFVEKGGKVNIHYKGEKNSEFIYVLGSNSNLPIVLEGGVFTVTLNYPFPSGNASEVKDAEKAAAEAEAKIAPKVDIRVEAKFLLIEEKQTPNQQNPNRSRIRRRREVIDMGNEKSGKEKDKKEDYDKDERELDEAPGSEGDEAMAVEQEEEAQEE